MTGSETVDPGPAGSVGGEGTDRIEIVSGLLAYGRNLLVQVDQRGGGLRRHLVGVLGLRGAVVRLFGCLPAFALPAHRADDKQCGAGENGQYREYGRPGEDPEEQQGTEGTEDQGEPARYAADRVPPIDLTVRHGEVLGGRSRRPDPDRRVAQPHADLVRWFHVRLAGQPFAGGQQVTGARAQRQQPQPAVVAVEGVGQQQVERVAGGCVPAGRQGHGRVALNDRPEFGDPTQQG